MIIFSFKRLGYSIRGLLMYLSVVIGPGVLILPRTIVDPGTAQIAWTLVSLTGIPMAHTFVLLARAYPCSREYSSIVNKAFGIYPAALCGWFNIFSLTVGTIIAPLSGGLHIATILGLSEQVGYIIAAIIISMAVTISYRGTVSAGNLHCACGVIIIACLLSVLFTSDGIFGIIPYQVLQHTNLTYLPKTLLLVIWSLVGLEAILRLKPVFYHPRKDIIWAGLGAAVLTGLIYLGITLRIHNISQGKSIFAFAPGNSIIHILLASVASLVVTYSFVIGVTHTATSLSRDRLIPGWFEHIHPRFSVPDRTILLSGTVALLGLILTKLFALTLLKLAYAANSLVIPAIGVTAAAGIKLIDSKLGKLSSSLTLLISLASLSLMTIWLVIPVIVLVTCIAYVSWKEYKEGLHF